MPTQPLHLRRGGPAAAARRWIISAIASPDIARTPTAPPLCTVGNTARPGSTGSGSRALRQQCNASSPAPAAAVAACRRSTGSTARRPAPSAALTQASRIFAARRPAAAL